jgi:hypothetical protein
MSSLARLVIAALALTACTPADRVAPVVVSTSDTRLAVHPRESSQCDDLEMDPVRDLMFDKCEAFIPRFEQAVSRACRKVAPVLADAAVGRGGLCFGGERPIEPDPRDAVEAARVSAARQLLPGLREKWREEIPCDDLGRHIWELDHAWRDTLPDPELGKLYAWDTGPRVDYPLSAVTVGSHLFARALAPRLPPASRPLLRKFLVCEMWKHPQPD